MTAPRTPLLTEKEAAEYLSIPVKTLRHWRHRWAHYGEGPKWVKLGRSVRYRASDIEAWLRRCEAPRRAS